MRRTLALILTALLFAINSEIIGNTEASMPNTPEFTLTYIDQSYDVPSSTTTKIDPYTGEQTVTTNQGYHVQNGTIEVKIKNQQFTPYFNSNENGNYLFYNVSYKGHYQSEWTYYPSGCYNRNSYATTHIAQ